MSDPSFVAKHFAGEYTHSGTHDTSMYFLTKYTLDIVHVRTLNFRRVVFKSNPSTWFAIQLHLLCTSETKALKKSLDSVKVKDQLTVDHVWSKHNFGRFDSHCRSPWHKNSLQLRRSISAPKSSSSSRKDHHRKAFEHSSYQDVYFRADSPKRKKLI